MTKLIVDGKEIERRIDAYAVNPHSEPARDAE
jgi:hypothetical protein